MLVMGRKFLAGGGKVTHVGRTYHVDKSTFIVIEMDAAQVGTTADEVSSFLYRILKERKLSGGAVQPNEDILREFGKDVTRDVLKQLEGEKKQMVAEVAPAAMRFDFWPLLHPRVVQLCRKLFKGGHRKEAVQAALTEIDEVVGRKYRAVHNDHRFGTAMMSKAFAKDAPVIQLFRVDDPMYGDLQEGYMHLFMGVMQAMRNPKSHSNFQIDERDAIEMLFLASRLLRKVDEAIKP